MFFLAVLAVLCVVGWSAQLAVALGLPCLVLTRRRTLGLAQPMFAILYFGTAYFATYEVCAEVEPVGSAKGILRAGPAFAETTMGSTPAALFLMLLIQGIVQMLGFEGERKLVVAPALTVHLLASIFYIAPVHAPVCTLAARWTGGSGVILLHYALWSASISSQVFTIFGVERELAASAQKADPAAQARAAARADGDSRRPNHTHRRCAVSLLCIQGMLGTGLLGDVLHGPLYINLLMLVCSFTCFYGLLHNGLVVPLQHCRQHRIAMDDAEGKHASKRYQRSALYLVAAWHTFPIVWALDNFFGLPDEQVRAGYLVSDILAKFLPPSLYISSIVMRTL